MKQLTEDHVLSRFDESVSLLIAEATIEANAKTRRDTKRWVPGGQSRQAYGVHFRQSWISELVIEGSRIGLRLLSVDQNGQKSPIHSEPLAADLFQLGDLYLWPTRLHGDGRFTHRPSATIRQLASTARNGRPLFQEEGRPHFAALFYVFDDAAQLVERTGIGAPDAALSKIGAATIPDLRVHAESVRASRLSAKAKHTQRGRLRLRNDDHLGTPDPSKHVVEGVDDKN